MVAGVERIGNYVVRDMGNGSYHVKTALPGHVGAGVWDEAGVQALRDKYSNQNGDAFVPNGLKFAPTIAEKKTSSDIQIATPLMQLFSFLKGEDPKNAGIKVDSQVLDDVALGLLLSRII